MRFNKLWLDTLVPNTLSAQELSDIITMAGLEVDTIEEVTGSFTNVVVGEVLSCEDHPDSDHLHVTKVNVGSEVLDIVCGAPNCRAGLKVACAKVGAVLPGDFKIKPAKLRGVPSNGMLCSYRELGLCEEGSGIIEFPLDAPVGTDIHDYLELNDKAIEVDLTANRADCLSMRGIAREVGVLTKTLVNYPEINNVNPTINDTFPVEVIDKEACPKYLSRVLKNVDLSKKSPLWMQERLRRCGIRSIDPVVDVTNYVMLELGQPMHAFDLDTLKDKIIVRKAQDGEELVLLNENTAKLKNDTLVIADNNGPLALAGIFGGAHSGVSTKTKNVLLESAYFSASAIKNRARSYSLATDASHRFERGVDYSIQRMAIERATALLLEICGGECGPVNETIADSFIPKANLVKLPLSLVKEVIGIEISKDKILDILTRLGLEPKDNGDEIETLAPAWRYDIAIPVDVIEEIARVYGYDNIPNVDPQANLRMVEMHEANVTTYSLKSLLADLGYNEVVTYSFVDKKVLQAINPNVPSIELPSPISADMSNMRTTLWAGLINTVIYNQNRQMNRMKLFETGLVFIPCESAPNGILQEERIGGVITGNLTDEHWTGKSRAFNFYDIKGDVEELINKTCDSESFTFKSASIEALHPGISAVILRDGKEVGFVGLIHPLLQKKLGLKQPVFLFELTLDSLSQRKLPSYKEVSKFPSIKRDLAIVIDKSVEASEVIKVAKKHGGKLLTDVTIFDIYEGEGLEEGKKSLAFSITMQTPERTLEDSDVSGVVDSVVKGLGDDLGASLRA
ncbi:MAG: phenylalanine--tRNA ligase subunit beta [Ruminobacter sp.]|nr:phenylalanine--tRNA ligase subunit beta [Ruminobacter sp.]